MVKYLIKIGGLDLINDKNKKGENSFLILCYNIFVNEIYGTQIDFEINMSEGENSFKMQGVDMKKQQYKEKIKIIKYLILSNCETNPIRNNEQMDGRYGFAYLCDCDDVELLKFVIENVSYSDEIFIKILFDGFHMACQYGFLNVIKFLIHSQGLTINQDEKKFSNGFQLACMCEQYNIIKFLLEHTDYVLKKQHYI